MCFSKEISIITYIIGIIGSILLYNKNNLRDNKILSIFFIWVIQMQMIDFILWINQECNNTNKIITKLGIIINHCEPLILYLALIYYKKISIYVHMYILLYLIITILYTIYVFKDKCSLVTEESAPHILWAWNSENYFMLYYLLFLITLFILMNCLDNDNMYINSIGFASFIISVIIYYKKKSIGAIWCFIAAFVPWIIYFK
jgi:hypothetical protein